MSQSPDEIRANIERSRAALSSDVDQLTDQADPRKVARRKVEDVKQSAVGLKDRVMGANSDSPSLGDRVSDAPSAVQAKTQGNPLAAGLVAFGVGLLVGGLIPASRQEQQAAVRLKESAEPVTEQLSGAAKEVGQNLQTPAQDAVAAVKDSASDAAQTVKEQGQSAAGNVQSQATESKQNVQDSASNA